MQESPLSNHLSYALAHQQLFFRVMLAQHNETGELAAVKILTNTFSQVHRKGFKNEFAILQELSHPNIIKLLSFYDQVPFEEGPTRKRKATALAIEYAPQGDLFRYLENHGRFSEKLARHFFSQLIEGTIEFASYFLILGHISSRLSP